LPEQAGHAKRESPRAKRVTTTTTTIKEKEKKINNGKNLIRLERVEDWKAEM
jgi:hypothetical protein